MAMSTSLGDYDLFFTAYTLDGVEDPAALPITFAYNGGPGVAATFVNLGLMGPDHILLDADGMITQVPTGYGPNPYSLLDLTDLVFIDPVGTGYSRAAGGTDPKVFYSYPTDNQSVGVLSCSISTATSAGLRPNTWRGNPTAPFVRRVYVTI